MPLPSAASIIRRRLPRLGAIPAPSIIGNPTLVGSWDFDDASSVTLTGNVIDSITSADGLAVTLTSSGSPTLAFGSNGKRCAQLVAGSSQYLGVTNDLGLTAADQGQYFVIADLQTSADQALFEVSSVTVVSSLNRMNLLYASNGISARKLGGSGGSNGVFSVPVPGRLALYTAYFFSTTGGSAGGASDKSKFGGSSQTPVSMTTTTLGARRASGGTDLYASALIYRVLAYSSVFTGGQPEAVIQWAEQNYGLVRAI